jgi:hypothetical protein
MTPMRAGVALLAALTLLTACGGSNVGAGRASSAGLLKPGALIYWEIATDPRSDQWEQLEELLGRFPDGDKWLGVLEKELVPALGDQLGVAVYPAEGSRSYQVVGLTNPENAQRTIALVKDHHEDAATRVVGDWVVAAESQTAIDAALRGGGTALADDENFKSAMAELPDDALTRVYVDPGQFIQLPGVLALLGLAGLDFAGAWGKPRADGAELALVLSGDGADRLLGGGEPYSSTLLERVPDDALAFASFRGEQLRASPLFALGLRELEHEYAVELDEILPLLDGEVAFFARPGLPMPELTLLFETNNSAAAKAAVERLLRLAPDEPKLSVGALDGIVAVSTAATPLDDLGASGPKLPDSDRYQDALAAADVPDQYMGLAYVDLAKAARLIIPYGGSAEVLRNLEPLRSLVAFGTKEGDEISARAVLEID